MNIAVQSVFDEWLILVKGCARGLPHEALCEPYRTWWKLLNEAERASLRETQMIYIEKVMS